MKIVVCVKQVPEVTNVQVDPKTGTLIREGVRSILNPFCEYALDHAVRLAQANGNTEIIAITMGPPQARDALLRSLELGADRGVLVTDRKIAGADTWATSYALAAAVKKLQADLVLCGMQAIDGDTAQTGPGITVHAEYALATYVSKVEEIDTKRAKVHRLLEEGYEICEVQLPALFTVVKEINEPRTPSLRGKMKAKSAQITVWTAESLNLDPDKCGLKGSPTQVVKVFCPEHRAGGERWEGDAPELAAKMLEIIRERVTA
jgi:electron transfer flavoprotein beta subunit